MIILQKHALLPMVIGAAELVLHSGMQVVLLYIRSSHKIDC